MPPRQLEPKFAGILKGFGISSLVEAVGKTVMILMDEMPCPHDGDSVVQKNELYVQVTGVTGEYSYEYDDDQDKTEPLGGAIFFFHPIQVNWDKKVGEQTLISLSIGPDEIWLHDVNISSGHHHLVYLDRGAEIRFL